MAAVKIGVAGPVGCGKTALIEILTRKMASDYSIGVITNDIYTKEDAQFLAKNSVISPERITGVETGGCPHTAIREDASMNLEAVDDLLEKFPDIPENAKADDIANILDQYQQDMKQYYDAQAENLDFKLPSTLKTINDWASDHTNGMIPTILDKIDEKVVTYLLNAIYFKADWASKFEAKNTEEEKFTATNGTIKLPLMHQNVLIQYLKNEDYSAIEIPYGNGLWKMTVMLPEEGKSTDDIINHLAENGFSDVEDYESLYNSIPGDGVFRTYEVDLKLPRFETTSDTKELDGGLISLLLQMGIRQAFDNQFAEIPNMCDKPVYIEMMRQKAKIKVNEEGSEATAVTVAGMGELTSAGPIHEVEIPQATFYANRPFVYVIREMSSGVILFVGKFTGMA